MAEFIIPLNDNRLGLIQQTLEIFPSQPLNSAVDLDGVTISQKGAVSLFPGREIIIADDDETPPLNSTDVKYQSYYTDEDNNQIPIIYTDDGEEGEWFYGDYAEGTATSLGTVTGGATVFCKQVRDLATGDRVLIFSSSTEVPKKSVNLDPLEDLDGYPANYATNFDADVDQSEISEDPSNFSVPENPPFLEVHKNKVWLADGILVMHSVTFKYESWQNNDDDGIKRAGWIQINPGDQLGDIVAIVSWQNSLVVFKKRGIYLITGSHSRALSGNTPGDPFVVTKTPSPIGLAGPYAFDVKEDDITFLDNNGDLRSLVQSIFKETASQEPLSYVVQPKFRMIPESDRKKVVVKDNTDLKHIWVGFHDGTDDDAKNNAVGIYDYRIGNWTFIHNVIKPQSLLYLEDKGFYTGTRDGEIHKQYTGTTHGLYTRPAFYTLPWFGAIDAKGNPTGERFRIKRLELDFASVKEGKLLCEVTWQNREGRYYDINFLDSHEGIWDDSDWDDALWGSGTGRDIIPKVVKPLGSGKLAQLKFYSSREDFAWTWVGGNAICESFGRLGVS